MKQSRRAFLAKASAAGAGLAITGMKMKRQHVEAKEGFSINLSSSLK
jgi:hypothetical protein